MKAHFRRLYEYNSWVNGLFADTLRNNEYQNEKITVLLAHMCAAELIWLSRIQPVEVRVPGVWEEMDLEEALQSLKVSNQLWLELVGRTDDFEKLISYKTTNGVEHQTILKDIITHVANHGTHHRGQIATLLRQEDIAPPASDFIFFTRKS